jgi:hypothetical protein
VSDPVRLIWRPIDRWPREQTVNRANSPFRTKDDRGWRTRHIPWSTTEEEMRRELRLLNVREAVVQLALTDRDIRNDGQIRANARLLHPGVVLTFTHPKQGPLTFACDKWTSWQANARGIVKGLEALRLLERYGITQSDEQYVGWKELGSATPMGERPGPKKMTIDEAARIVAGWVSGPHDLEKNAELVLEDGDYRRFAYRRAAAALHPDKGGDAQAFLRLQEAKELLDAGMERP